jgi:hypothetical protein
MREEIPDSPYLPLFEQSEEKKTEPMIIPSKAVSLDEIKSGFKNRILDKKGGEDSAEAEIIGIDRYRAKSRRKAA